MRLIGRAEDSAVPRREHGFSDVVICASKLASSLFRSELWGRASLKLPTAQERYLAHCLGYSV